MDGGLSDNNPSLVALQEMKRVMPECRRPDQFVSVGTGACGIRRICSPEAKSSCMSSMSSIPQAFEHYWKNNFDGDSQFLKLRQALTVMLPDGDGDVDKWFRRFNLSLEAELPDLADAQAMDSLADAAMAHFISEPAIEDLALSVLASTFYFELRCLPIYEKGYYACYGRILSRVPVAHPAFLALMKRLNSLQAEFVVQGRVVRDKKLTRERGGNFSKPVCVHVQELEDQVDIRLRLSGKHHYHISASPFSVKSLIDLQKLEWASIRNTGSARLSSTQKRPSSSSHSSRAKRRCSTL
jgi:hypothetical protein